MTAHYDPTTERWTVKHDTLPLTPAQKRRVNSLRNCARMLAREIQSATPAEQSWTVYFDLEDSGSYVFQDGELFREEPGGTYCNENWQQEIHKGSRGVSPRLA
jgi:hypothetical protein